MFTTFIAIVMNSIYTEIHANEIVELIIYENTVTYPDDEAQSRDENRNVSRDGPPAK